jgi:hypothetical protein
MPFETPLPAGFFDVSDITATLQENAGVPPTTVLRTNQTWFVNVHWETTGLITSWVAGNWDLHLYLESMGPGDEIEVTDPIHHVVPLTPGPSPISYDFPINVVAGIVVPGAYKLVFTARYITPLGDPGQMAGYWEGPIIQFYNP